MARLGRSSSLASLCKAANCGEAEKKVAFEKRLEEMWELLAELQGIVVDINFSRKEASHIERRGVPAQLQWVLHRCQELLRCIQVMAEQDPESQTSVKYTTLTVELEALRQEASQLLEYFCVPGLSEADEGVLDVVIRNILGAMTTTCTSKRQCCLDLEAMNGEWPAEEPERSLLSPR